MRKITKLLSVFVVAGAVSAGAAFTGCAHKHTFENGWEHDENQHWHVATCEHTDQKGSLGNHVDEDGDGICDVCEYEMSEPTPGTEYTITFNLNGHGTGTNTTVQTVNGKATAPATAPTDENYNFVGWFTKDGTGEDWGVQFSANTVHTANTPYYAKWTAKQVNPPAPGTEYTITFNLNGHGTGTNTTVQTVNGKATAPATAPTDENYDFVGWFTKNGTNEDWGEEFSANTVHNAATTYYAKWTAKQVNPPAPGTEYTITFNLNGHGTGTNPTAQTVEGKATAPATAPTDENYDFVGWFTKDGTGDDWGEEFSANTVHTANTPYYAKWTAKQVNPPAPGEYTVTFNLNYENATGAPAAQTVAENGMATVPTAPTREGYTFEGWFTDAACGTQFTFTTQITANTTLYAKWVEKQVVQVSGTVKIIKAEADLEAAYVTWEPVQGAEWYNVYYKIDGGDAFVKLDDELVRQYKEGTTEYYRADAVGLKGMTDKTYILKVVPVGGDDKEVEASATQITGLVVKAHDRAGYAFVNGTSSGAYNEDGTLKQNANVVYVTPANKDKVSLNVTGATANPCVGVQDILYGYKKGKETKPLCIRLIGNITDFSNMDKGDIVIDGVEGVGVTFEGIGSDATANGWGLRVKGSSNIEIRNIGFMNCDSSEGDNIGLQQDNNHVWVHNCDLFYGHAGSDKDQVKGDGALDTKKSTYITHSYNHFYDSGKCNLQGNTGEVTSNSITYHHNWYDHSDSRHPRIRVATVHVYNNYFDGNAKYGVGATMGSNVFVENNYFRSTARMRPMLTSMQGTDISVPDEKGNYEGTFSSEDGGSIKAFGNIYDCPTDKLAYLVQSKTKNEDAGKGVDAWEAATRDEQVPSSYAAVKGGATYSNFDTKSDFYKYTVDSAEEAKIKVEKYAGRIGGGDFKWDFDDATEDPNYAVIAELKTALMSYKGTLVKVGGAEVGSSTGGSTGGDTPVDPTPVDPTPDEPITGTVTYVPATDGLTGKSIISVTGGTYKSGSPAITINGTAIPADKALKINSKATITITNTQAMTLTIYINLNSVKVDGAEKTGVSGGAGYYIITVELAAGTHTITKGDSESQLFMLTLAPKA